DQSSSGMAGKGTGVIENTAGAKILAPSRGTHALCPQLTVGPVIAVHRNRDRRNQVVFLVIVLYSPWIFPAKRHSRCMEWSFRSRKRFIGNENISRSVSSNGGRKQQITKGHGGGLHGVGLVPG